MIATGGRPRPTSRLARWNVELGAYRQWCAVCQRAITQSGVEAQDILEKVLQHQRPS